MKVKRWERRMLLMLPVILLSLCLLSGCAEKSTVRDSAAVEETAEVRWQDYNGKRLGVLVGPLMEDATAQFFPDSEYLLFNSYPDCVTALLTGKIDGFLGDEPGMIAMHAENPEIDYIHEALSENNYAFAFRKDDARSAALCDELDAFLERAWADGTMDDIAAIWLGSDESRKTVDMSDLTGENGTIRVVTTSTDMPWSYIKDGKNVGYDIDLVVRFCRERGYALELGDVDFAGRIPAVQSGKYDFSTDMNATPERAEQVRFSAPTAHGGFVLVVRAEDLNTSVPSRSAPEYRTFEDLRGKTVSMITGAPFVELIRDKIADVGELTYFNSTPDMLLALKSGKTDAALANCAVASLAVSRDPDLALLSDTLMDCVFGFPFAKGDPARDDWQAACDAIPEETKQALWEKWTGADDSKKTMPAQDWPGRNGTVQVAACDTLEPTCYIGEDGALTGFDIEMILKMAEIMDVHVEFTGMEFSSVLASVQAGKALFGAGAVFVTEERMETMDFVEYFPASFVMIVRKAETASAEARASVPEITDYSGLSGKTVSMLTGAPFEDLVRSKAPTVGEFSFFNNMPDMLLALESEKTDAALINNAIAALAVNRDSALALFPQNLQDGAFGFAFAKGDPRRDTWQAACDAIPEAQIQAAWDKWTGADEGVKALPEQTWPGLNGTVRVAACDTLEPMSYAGEGGELIGFDLEVLLMIARALDVRVEFTGMEFSAILSSVQSGKADIGAGSIIITAERAESVDFVEYYPAAFVLIVRSKQAETGGYTSADDLRGKTIACTTGSITAEYVKDYFNGDVNVKFFDSHTDMVLALNAGKIDAYCTDSVAAGIQSKSSNGATRSLSPPIHTTPVGFVFQKGSEQSKTVRAQFNEYLADLGRERLSALQEYWLGDDEDIDAIDMSFTGENGHLKMAVATSFGKPWCYIKDGAVAGFEMQLAADFCREYGYSLEFVDYDFQGMLAAVQSGKCDMAGCAILRTTERLEQMDYSESTADNVFVLVVSSSGTPESDTVWDRIGESFEKTFLREGRWKLFVQGIGTTLLITILSIILGTALGFGVYLLCRSGNPIANGVTRFFVWLIHGMPMVVLLMILYYIIFGKVAISGTIVAVIGFTLVFGASVFGMLKSGVGAVEKGQMEAAYALGYTDNRAFFRVILPQALPHFFPAYKGEITATIKATAIVGYVAVQDLTKMGDIVRSRTYEAFFPLIAVAVIYFILAGILTAIVNRLGVFIDPRRRKKEDVLKGVTVE